jgi:hypothetical protein
MIKIEKWNATGLLDSVSIENKQFVAETLETAMAQVLAGQAEYADFESKIVELREQGFFNREKANT